MFEDPAGDPPGPPSKPSWTYLTNHAHVLIYLAGHPGVTIREIAGAVGITERAVHRIVAELEEDGVLSRVKQGRRNDYEIDLERPLRNPVESHCSVRELLELVLRNAPR